MTGNKPSSPHAIGRRAFLRYAGAGLGALAASACVGSLAGCSPPTDLAQPSANEPDNSDHDRPPDTEINLRAVPDTIDILPGPTTRVWRFVTEVIKGRADAVQELPGSYLGPILTFTQGERVRINFFNELSEPSIVHWHGLHIPEAADGHPRLAIEPGESYTYDFTVRDRAGTYWYHPHPHGRTGPQVYNGLAGLLIVKDEEETAMGLPNGDYDVPLVIQDRTFDADNQLVYLDGSMQGHVIGFYGDRILVNGQPETTRSVEARPYRLRILNGSNARIYKLAWQDDRAITAIGTDGGLLTQPITRPYITLAPGERIELWADFTTDTVGSRLTLESQSFSGSDTFPVMQFVVEEATGAGPDLPKKLSEIVWHSEEDATNRGRPRTFEIDMRHMTWRLNGRTFEMEEVAPDERVRLGDLEIWEFINESPRMAMAHPLHIHNVQFQVLERQILPAQAEPYQSLSEGYVDAGWKDTVLLLPGERVRLLLKFERYAGLYLYHCHNLEHEDMGMMRNYRIRA